MGSFPGGYSSTPVQTLLNAGLQSAYHVIAGSDTATNAVTGAMDDYVLVKGFTVQSASVLSTEGAVVSSHYPVVATLSLA